MSVNLDFSDVFDHVESIERTDKKGIAAWEGPIPEFFLKEVAEAHSTGDAKLIKNLQEGAEKNDVDVLEFRDYLKSALRAAIDKVAPGRSITTRDIFDEDGYLVALRFSVGKPRGRRPSQSD